MTPTISFASITTCPRPKHRPTAPQTTPAVRNALQDDWLRVSTSRCPIVGPVASRKYPSVRVFSLYPKIFHVRTCLVRRSRFRSFQALAVDNRLAHESTLIGPI